MNDLENQYHIRRLLPFDIDAFRRHLLRLDADSRYMRFGAPVRDEFIHDYADTAYRLDTLTYGLFVEGEIHAAAELRPLTFEDGGMAEIAFSVEREDQSQGIGSLLMERIVMAARNRGIAHLTVFCVPGNERMRHLAEKFGAQMHSEQGEMTGKIKPAPPTPFSYLDETLQEAEGAVNALLDQAGRWTEGTQR